MKAGTNYTLLIVIFIILVAIWNNLSPKEKPDEIVIDGIHTPRKPCISVMNELYGAGIDSNKVCDCLIPNFYELIKDDSLQLAKFKDVGIHVLDGEKNERSILMFEKCLRENLINSSFKLHLKGTFLTGFKSKLLQAITSKNITNNYNKEALSNCIIDKMNNNVTLGEYLAADYSKVEKIMSVFNQCIRQSKE